MDYRHHVGCEWRDIHSELKRGVYVKRAEGECDDPALAVTNQIITPIGFGSFYLGHLARQGIEKILDGTFPVFCPVEDDRSVHGDMLTRMLTYVKAIISLRCDAFIQ